MRARAGLVALVLALMATSTRGSGFVARYDRAGDRLSLHQYGAQSVAGLAAGSGSDLFVGVGNKVVEP